MSRHRWLVYSIVTTLVDELAVVLAAGLLLPRFGLSFPWQVVAGAMAAVACWSVIGYYIGVSVMGLRPVLGKEAMVGKSGVVVRPLEPLGMVKIEGELWQAESGEEPVCRGEEVVVLAQQDMYLVVEKRKTSEATEVANNHKAGFR